MSHQDIAPNGSSDRLGDDELGYIMSLVVGDSSSIPTKLALGQVSRRWRAVSASTSSMWAKFAVKTPGDAFNVPTVMKRARGALLDVSLDFGMREDPKDPESPPVPLIDFNTRAGIYASLKPQMHRIRSLSIDFGGATKLIGPDEPLDDLFEFAIPRMEHLAIHWRMSRWQRHPIGGDSEATGPIVIPLELPTETAPRLRSVSMTNVVPADWNAVVFPTIESLHIDAAVADPNLLRAILETCPLLQHLGFLPSCTPWLTFDRVPSGQGVCANLRSVHIGTPFGNIFEVLRTAVNRKNLDAITVNMRDEGRDLEVLTVARAILPGLGSPVAFGLTPADPETYGDQVLTMEDATGRTRSIIVADARQRQNPFAQMWAHVAAHGDLGGIQRVTFAQRDYFNVVAAFNQHAPRHPRLELRVVLPAGNYDDERFVSMLEPAQRPGYVMGVPNPETLHCSTLTKITFDVSGTVPARKRAVVYAILDNIGIRLTQPTLVCVVNCSQRQHWIMCLTNALARRTGWALCDPTCSHL